MKIFLDTADIGEIKQAHQQGLLDGVTTNPSLVAKTGQPHESLIKTICELLGDKPVSAEVLSVQAREMAEEGRRLSKIHPSVVVKIPLIPEGLKAVKQLSAEGIATNVTLCFSPLQALLAAKAGASYVSVFMGRLDDVGHKGSDTALDCHEMLLEHGFPTQLLAASVRHPEHALEMAKGGVPVCAMPYKVFCQLAKHPLTDLGLAAFLKDAGVSQ